MRDYRELTDAKSQGKPQGRSHDHKHGHGLDDDVSAREDEAWRNPHELARNGSAGSLLSVPSGSNLLSAKNSATNVMSPIADTDMDRDKENQDHDHGHPMTPIMDFGGEGEGDDGTATRTFAISFSGRKASPKASYPYSIDTKLR